MRVGIIGLGSIARKAYLPVVTAMPGVTPVLVSRDRRKLAAVGAAYRVPDRFQSAQDALGSGLDAAMVHTPSQTHPEIVEALLRAGVPVLVDKPLATDHATARGLARLAGELGVSLMVGFNRRYSPSYRALAEWADRDVVSLHKHRANEPGPARAMVFDDFIHVVDTLRFLVPSTMDDLVITANVGDDGRCRRLAIQFTGEGRLAFGVMSWTAGMSHEVLDVIGDRRRRQVTDLADIVDFAGQERLARRDSWAPATQLRGFLAMCADFVSAVEQGRSLDPTDALITHETCERVVADAASQPGWLEPG